MCLCEGGLTLVRRGLLSGSWTACRRPMLCAGRARRSAAGCAMSGRSLSGVVGTRGCFRHTTTTGLEHAQPAVRHRAPPPTSRRSELRRVPATHQAERARRRACLTRHRQQQRRCESPSRIQRRLSGEHRLPVPLHDRPHAVARPKKCAADVFAPRRHRTAVTSPTATRPERAGAAHDEKRPRSPTRRRNAGGRRAPARRRGAGSGPPAGKLSNQDG